MSSFHLILISLLGFWLSFAKAAPLVERDVYSYSTAGNCSLDSPWIVSGLLAYNYTIDISTGNYSNVIAVTVNASAYDQLYYAQDVKDATIFTFYPCNTTQTLIYPEDIPHDPIKAVYGHVLQNGTESEKCLKMNNALSVPLSASVEDCPEADYYERAFGWFTFSGGNSPSFNPITLGGHGFNATDLFGVSDRNSYNQSLTNGSTVGPVLFNRYGSRLTWVPVDQIAPDDS